MKSLLKEVIYRVHPQQLPAGLKIKLGYIFHTEAVFDTEIFERQLTFLKAYRTLTGQSAICTLMTAANQRVKQGMAEHGISDELFAERVRRIGEHASLGYHGHYYFDEANYLLPEAEIRCNNFKASVVREQFARELEWFETHKISHEGSYSAGWWFMNAPMQKLLIENGFKLDFSFSKSPWFRNQYSHELMERHQIPLGEPLRVRWQGGDLFCVQNLIGCHTTRFPDDYIRNLRSLMDYKSNSWLAVTHSHDFDLDLEDTLRCLEALIETGSVEMVSIEEFRDAAKQQAGTPGAIDL